MTDVPSPCINICDLDRTEQYCLGCGRSLDEIAKWRSASESERRKISDKLSDRLLSLNREQKS